MSIRRLILVENKILSEEDKIEFVKMIKDYDEIKEKYLILEGKYKRSKKQNGELKEIVDMYKNCVTDMAGDMVIGGVYTEEYYQDKYERKWGIIE